MLPGWYRAWAVGRGLDPFHPEGWATADRDAFCAEKLRRFREKWRLYRDDGTTDAYRQQGARAALIRRVRDDVLAALAPAPGRNPWAQCPCHPHGGTPLYDPIGLAYWPEGAEASERLATPEETEAYIAEDPFERASLRPGVVDALAYLSTFHPKEPTP